MSRMMLTLVGLLLVALALASPVSAQTGSLPIIQVCDGSLYIQNNSPDSLSVYFMQLGESVFSFVRLDQFGRAQMGLVQGRGDVLVWTTQTGYQHYSYSLQPCGAQLVSQPVVKTFTPDLCQEGETTGVFDFQGAFGLPTITDEQVDVDQVLGYNNLFVVQEQTEEAGVGDRVLGGKVDALIRCQDRPLTATVVDTAAGVIYNIAECYQLTVNGQTHTVFCTLAGISSDVLVISTRGALGSLFRGAIVGIRPVGL
jgi:hypothetical protein